MARVLVLGAYGLIGSAIARGVAIAGHEVTGLGRDRAAASRSSAAPKWIFHDLRDLQTTADWQPVLKGFDFVVNAAGALQDTPRDNLAALHSRAIAALAHAAAEAGIGVVQISAVGVATDASTNFLRTKAEGDAALLASGAPVWILRPGLVIAPDAYGGTELMRMLTAMPLIQPVAMADAPVQVVAIDDVVRAVLAALSGELPQGSTFDLVAEPVMPLRDVVITLRAWLGFGEPAFVVSLPDWMLTPVRCCADALGRLGWRSPLRSNAIFALRDGITGDGRAWAATGLPQPMPLDTYLHSIPARREDRLFARMRALFPFVIATLSIFWLISGIIGFWQVGPAAHVLTKQGWSEALARAAVIGFACVDVALGMMVLVRRYARSALFGMLGVSLLYLVTATIFTASLWADPLGPLVKVVPQMMLVTVALAMLETR